MIRRCHICNAIVNNRPSHWKIHKDIPKEKLKYDYLLYNFPRLKDSDLIKQLYINEEYSLPMLCKEFGDIDLKSMIFILEYIGIKHRNQKQSCNLVSSLSRREKTCLIKYGKKNCLSKNTTIYTKRNKTVKDKYGVDNVLQCFYDFTSEHINKIRKISKLNKRIQKILEQNKINYEMEFRIGYINEEDNKNHYKFYDFHIIGTNILIEVNGDYWHANPSIYKKDDKLCFPYGRYKIGDCIHIKAEYIWELDTLKRQVAQVNNFDVLYIWEKELKESTNDEIVKKIKNYINRKN